MKLPNARLLLHPTLPPPLHGVNPRTIKGSRWWNKVRQEAYAKFGYKCWACGTFKEDVEIGPRWLECHEAYNIDWEHGIVTLDELVALCWPCHNYIHIQRLHANVHKGKTKQETLDKVILHGEAVLRAAGYSLMRPETPLSTATWDQWRLTFDGKEYYSDFNNVGEWANHYDVDLTHFQEVI